MDLVPRGSSPWLAKLNPSTKHSHSFATNLKRYYNLDSIATMPISLFLWGKGVLTDNARFSSPLYGFSRPMSDVVYVVKGKEEHWKFYVAIKLRAEQWSNDDKCFLGCNQPNWNHQTAVCRNSLFFSFKHKQASSLMQTFFDCSCKSFRSLRPSTFLLINTIETCQSLITPKNFMWLHSRFWRNETNSADLLFGLPLWPDFFCTIWDHTSQ